MKLLSVAEVNGSNEGRIANLYIDVKPGGGRVFIDTFPLTRLDTQISTRFAKETACKFLNRNCDYVDFFYTLRSDAPLLGGPSAGASVAVITAAMIDNLKLNDKVAMTGTINSGGVIGQVSGIKYKIDAAFNEGLEKVLIPYGMTSYTYVVHGQNKTIDFVEYGKDLGIEVVYVRNLNEALYEFTGKRYNDAVTEINVPNFYTETMLSITDQLCYDALRFETEFNNLTEMNLSDDKNNAINLALRLTNQSKDAYADQKYYSAASFCFGANIRFNYINFLLEYDISDDMDLNETFIDYLNQKVIDLENETNLRINILDNYEIITITDLQAYMVVRERLLETIEQIDLAKIALNSEDIDAFFYRLSFANERFKTARLWSEFFGKDGVNLRLNNDLLRNSCIRKISETQERIEYVRLSFPTLDFSSYFEGISTARRDLNNQEYALCLFKISKTKADIEVFISAIGLSDLDSFVDTKVEMARMLISKQQKSNLFPILGYSYFEYAELLKEDDPASALLYSEYALELSDLDLYFGVRGRPYIVIDWNMIIYFVLGLFSGITVSLLIYNNYKNSRNKKNPRKIPKGTLPGKKR